MVRTVLFLAEAGPFTPAEEAVDVLDMYRDCARCSVFVFVALLVCLNGPSLVFIPNRRGKTAQNRNVEGAERRWEKVIHRAE